MSSSHIQEAYVLTKSLISAPMGITGSSSAKEVEAAEEFTIQTKRQISRGESRDHRSPAPTAEVSRGRPATGGIIQTLGK